MELLRIRGGVPVFSLPKSKLYSAKKFSNSFDALSPFLPEENDSCPIWILPPKNVPVVKTTASEYNLIPCEVMIPFT